MYCNTTAVSVTRNRLECARTVHWNEGCVPYLFVGHTVGEVQNKCFPLPLTVMYPLHLAFGSLLGSRLCTNSARCTSYLHRARTAGARHRKSQDTPFRVHTRFSLSRLELGPFLMGKSADTRKTHRNPCTGTAVSPCDRRSLSYSLPLKDLKEGSR